MSIYKVSNPKFIRHLVAEWKETLIWSYLDGYMGQAWACGEESPESVMIQTGDFWFFAGKPNLELAGIRLEGWDKDFALLVPENEEWSSKIEKAYGTRVKRNIRYAIKKEKDAFDLEKLSGIVKSLDTVYTLTPIDEELYNTILHMEWAMDWCSNFASYEDYKQHGLGFLAIKDGEIVSGASTYSYYNGGIEIEIDTREDYRRKGLALCCGAKLILECVNRGLYPSWDAANMGSVALSEKLGYHFDREYPIYELYPY